MAKILAIIILIALIGGGGWYYTNSMRLPKSGEAVSFSVSTTTEVIDIKNKSDKSYITIISPVKELFITKSNRVEWKSRFNNLFKQQEVYIYLLDSKIESVNSPQPILLGKTLRRNNFLDFNLSTSTTMGIADGWVISIFDKTIDSPLKKLLATKSNLVITEYNTDKVFFNSYSQGPAVKSVGYTLIKRSNSVPKIKINCLADVFVFDSEKQILRSGDDINHVCNKYVLMKDLKEKTHEGKNVYNYVVDFINQSIEVKSVSAEVEFDGRVINLDQNFMLSPTNSSILEIANG